MKIINERDEVHLMVIAEKEGIENVLRKDLVE